MRAHPDPGDGWNAVVWKIKLRFDALYNGTSVGYRSWEEFFPPTGRSGQRRADAADAIRCTGATYERCLRIANDICRAAELVGFQIAMGYQCTYIALRRDGADSRLRVVEPCFRANTELLSKEERASVYSHGLIGTGWLEVHVNELWTSGAVFKEKSGVELADSLPGIVAEIERRHRPLVASVEKQRRTEVAVARARIEREAFERGRAEERKWRDELIARSQQWHASQMIRTYVMAMAEQVPTGKLSAEEYERWRAWAIGIADEMDKESIQVPVPLVQPPNDN